MKYIKYIITLIYFCLVLFGVVRFQLWGQVEYFYVSESNIQDLLRVEQILNGHASRYLLVYPIYWLSDLTGLDRHFLFSIVVMLLVFLTSKVFSKILIRLEGFSKPNAYILSLLLFGGLSLNMNGRIIFAVFAMTWSTWLLVRWHSGEKLSAVSVLLSCLCILWLSSVSSGTFSVIFIAIFIWLLWIIARSINELVLSKHDFLVGVSIVVSLFCTTPLFFNFLEKNMTYYGGGVIAMLEHGVGGMLLFSSSSNVVMAFPVILLFCLLYMALFFSVKKYKPVLMCLAVGMLGGLFGNSTLVMSLPPLFILLLSMFSRKIILYKQCANVKAIR